MAATNYNPFLGMNQYRNHIGPQSNFTFTTPTQCSTLGTPRPCIETMSPINLSAPGVGASWQHSIPTTMPWVDLSSSSQNITGGSATVFTGMPFNIYTSHVSPAANNPSRSKRKAQEDPTEAPVSKVLLCADQLANMRITHSEHGTSDSTHMSHLETDTTSLDDGSNVGHRKHASKSKEWERFRELENRLTADSDEELGTSSRGGVQKGGIQIHVSDGVINGAKNNSPILPRKVMEDINKPCMQIVLWQSPEKLIRDIATEDSTSLTVSLSSSTKPSRTTRSVSNVSSVDIKSSSSSSSFPTSTGSPAGSSCMDTMSSEHTFDPFRFNNFKTEAAFSPCAFSRQTSSACRLAPSPNFLKPLSSSSDLPFFSSASSASSHLAPGTGGSPLDFGATHGSRYLNNNNNNNILSSSNILNNVMDMFDSVDDDMQL